MISEGTSDLRRRARAPKTAAIAGIVFSVLLFISLVLLFNALSVDTDITRREFVANKNQMKLALNLIPFASIAFLWFVGVVRDRFGNLEDQFFSTVFLGSALLFIAMLFMSSSIAGSFFLLSVHQATQITTSGYQNLGLLIARETMTNYGIRMAGVFMISTSSLFIRTGVIPRWLAWIGLGLAAIMILRIGYINRLGWVFLSFPLWVLLVSVYILIDNYRNKKEMQTPQ